MKAITKAAAAFLIGLGALGFTAASADDRGRDRDDRQRERNYRDNDRHDDRRGDRRSDRRRDDHRDNHRADNRRRDDHRDNHRSDNRRRDNHRADNHRNDNRRYSSYRPTRCTLDHDHRYHNRDYYSYYPKDRYYRADPQFSISLSFGNGGYYDRGGRYYDRPYYDRRGYRDAGRVVDRDIIRLRGYRAEAVLVEEVYYGRRGNDRVCTVTARGPDARYVPYGQLRQIAERRCSHRADIRVYA
ncbi:MAG: hypothetical protein AB7F91_05975 [Parvularculaceae bacterium]|nr:hypothetical protein [Parvularculaceae bacterium]